MDKKQAYRDLCQAKSAEIPIFSKDWWLDTVCGKDNWEVMLTSKNDQIQGALPFTSIMPTLTQNFKVWINYPKEQKLAEKLSFEKEILESLINEIPRNLDIGIRLHHSLKNHLPFYWAGYDQTTRYTYILKNVKSTPRIWDGFRDNIRREVRKAESRVGLKINNEPDIKLFYDLSEMTFKRQNIKMPYNLEALKNLDQTCAEKKCRKMYFAEDHDGKVHAAIYIVWDEKTAYYLMGGANPDLRNSGATSFLMWQAIQDMAEIVEEFDFEGSMIPTVERYFRSFGAEPIPYFSLEKNNSIPKKIKRALKELLK